MFASLHQAHPPRLEGEACATVVRVLLEVCSFALFRSVFSIRCFALIRRIAQVIGCIEIDDWEEEVVARMKWMLQFVLE